jgi:Ca2+-transporting ATPase
MVFLFLTCLTKKVIREGRKFKMRFNKRAAKPPKFSEPPKPRPWHTKTAAETESKLQTSREDGLSETEALHRLQQYGSNEIKRGQRKTLLTRIKEQLLSFMIIILLAAALLSALLGQITDAVVILAIVIINTVISLVQENKAEKSLEALQQLAAPAAKVYRAGNLREIAARDLVPGDLVVLETGALVPADLRLAEAANLKVMESMLTGESAPVEKKAAITVTAEALPGDRHNMAFMGTTVVYGRGKGLVAETGQSTQVGQIAAFIQAEKEEASPLQKRLEALGKTLGGMVIVTCIVMFLTGIAYGRETFGMLLTAVSLAVAAVPEGLPAIATVVLALGVRRMALRKAIIKKLPAVETLGNTTVICSDKTGTLTKNKMTVQKIFSAGRVSTIAEALTRSGFQQLVQTGVLCNDAQIVAENNRSKNSPPEVSGDPTETALVELGLRAGQHKGHLESLAPRVLEIPFDSLRKRMTTVHHSNNLYKVYTKGAVDTVLPLCSRIIDKGEITELTAEKREEIASANEGMAAEALRVLCLAYKEMELPPTGMNPTELEGGLIFAGLVGMIDPPRPEARQAVEKCWTAGMRPVMITGDHQGTALAIAREVGILKEKSKVITGAELEKMDDDTLAKQVMDCGVYARVAPEHKLRIVKALKKRGQVVAMTGDGVNDAPALKTADIGIAMGITGTDVAKEAAAMILADDNFATIVTAMEEGRTIYDNIIKALQFLLSCNIGEILVLFLAVLLNWDTPLLPVHILWVNLVTDSFPALAFGVEPPEKEIMTRKPRRPGSSFFTPEIITRILYQGLMIGALTLAAYILGRTAGLGAGRTMAFLVLGFSQLTHAFNVRSSRLSVFSRLKAPNYYLFAGTGFSALLMAAIMIVPSLKSIFQLTGLTTGQWAWVFLLAALPLFIVETIKLLGLNAAQRRL